MRIALADGGLARTVAVRPDSPADVQFVVHCLRMTGRLAVDVVTSGAAPDPDGYEVAVDGLFKGRVPATGYLDVPEVAVGDRVVELRGVAGNCTVGPANPTPVRVEYNVAVPVAFEVTCPPGTASIRVTTVTTGADPDPDGYLVCVDDSRCNPLPPNGSFTFSRLVPGSHVVGLVRKGGELPAHHREPAHCVRRRRRLGRGRVRGRVHGVGGNR